MNLKFGLSRRECGRRNAEARAGDAARAGRTPFAPQAGGAGSRLAARAPRGRCRGRLAEPAPAPGPPVLRRRYGRKVTAVRVSVPAYGPATVVAGIARSRLALRVLVPNPLPACACARIPAVVPRPGLAGATTGPRVAPVATVPV